MPNFNSVVLLGRLTRDPERITFNSGGGMVKFGLATISGRKKNQTTGEYEDEPVFVDCCVFNRGEYGKMADNVEKLCRKGQHILIEGKLRQENWEDKQSGQKRSKLSIVVDGFQVLEKREASNGTAGGDYDPGLAQVEAGITNAEPDAFGDPPF